MNTSTDTPTPAEHAVLLVEDDRDIVHLIELHLRDLGCRVEMVYDGKKGLERALEKDFDLIILDIMLPGMDGLELCKQVRSQADYTPILMLTAKSTELDRVLGLEMGADDYLTKPFSLRELMARVKALFRRVEAMRQREREVESVIRLGELTVDPEKRKITLRGEEVSLTAKEFELLHQFAKHPGRVYSRAQLLDLVWGHGYQGFDHTVNSHINRLRAKLEHNPADPQYILTVWGVGYKLTEPQAAHTEENHA